MPTAQPQKPQAAVAAHLNLQQQHQQSSPGQPPQQQDVPVAQQREAMPAEQQQGALPAAQHVLLTRRTLAELFLTLHQLQQLVPLELLLRGGEQARRLPVSHARRGGWRCNPPSGTAPAGSCALAWADPQRSATACMRCHPQCTEYAASVLHRP